MDTLPKTPAMIVDMGPHDLKHEAKRIQLALAKRFAGKLPLYRLVQLGAIPSQAAIEAGILAGEYRDFHY